MSGTPTQEGAAGVGGSRPGLPAVSSGTQASCPGFPGILPRAGNAGGPHTVSNLTRQLGHGVPRYWVKCDSGYFCEGVLDETGVSTGGLRKAGCSSQRDGPSLSPSEAWVEQHG